jgi:N-acetylglucosamine-6-sulfatase
MGFNWGLRTATHKYIEYSDGYVQLFDLTTDPWELTNLGSDPAQAPLIADLHARLSRLRTTEEGP